MVIKKFYDNNAFSLEHHSVKKLFSEKIYNKFFIRSAVRKSKTLKIIDSGSTFFHISSKKLLGSAFYGKHTIYTSQLNKNLKFKYFSAHETAKTTEFLKQFLTFSAAKKSMILVKPLKGGYKAFAGGILGFLPRSHGSKILTNDALSMPMKVLQPSLYLRRYPLTLGRINIAPLYRKKFPLRNPKKKFLILRYVFLSIFNIKRRKLSVINAS